jgi:hypothetical protein
MIQTREMLYSIDSRGEDPARASASPARASGSTAETRAALSLALDIAVKNPSCYRAEPNQKW